jgi:uncharacterized protein YutE (UPF0331/DUF86 family)
MLDKNFIIRKVQLIEEDLNKLQLFANKTIQQIAQNDIEQAAVERYLERIVTRAIDINNHLITELGDITDVAKTYRETFLKLAKFKVYSQDFADQIAPSAGLRNALVHEYDTIDHELVEKSIKQAIVEYNTYAKYIMEFIENNNY